MTEKIFTVLEAVGKNQQCQRDPETDRTSKKYGP